MTVLQNLREEVYIVERVVSSLCGLSAGIGLVCLAVSGLEQHERQQANEASSARAAQAFFDAAERAAAEQWPDSLARELVRKNSRTSLNEAYTFVEAEPLGVGSFGVVMHAVHNRTGIERAVKIIKKEPTLDPIALSLEVESLRRLDHPHVCRLVEYFETGSHLCLVTELCRGEELCSRLLEMPRGVSETEAAALMYQMLRATLHCHRRSLVHRDLKPENFLFRRQGDALKLIDFGSAEKVSSSPGRSHGRSQSSRPAGTLLYMAPQMLRGDAPSKADDAWSLGVILHLLLTGRFPFSTNDDRRFQDLFARGQLEKDVGTHLNDLRTSPTASDLLRRLLAVEPSERLSVEEALQHPFLAAAREASSAQRLPAEDVYRRLLHFLRSCRLRRIVATAIGHLLDECWGPEAERARETFVQLDKGCEGRVAFGDLLGYLQDGGLRVPSGWRGATVESAELAGIGYTAFLAAMLTPRRLAADERLCRAVFDMLDADRDGALVPQDLRCRLGMPLQECELALREALGEPAATTAPTSPRMDFPSFHHMMLEGCA